MATKSATKPKQPEVRGQVFYRIDNVYDAAGLPVPTDEASILCDRKRAGVLLGRVSIATVIRLERRGVLRPIRLGHAGNG